MSEEHNLVLIMARALASSIATPTFLTDPEGTLVYFNEPAEAILGQTYAEAGEMKLEDWGSAFYPADPESGERINPEALPLTIALFQHKPAHRSFHITGRDGVRRMIAVTAFPLFARADEFIGAVAFFWEEG